MFYFKNDSSITVYYSDGKSAIWTINDPDYSRVVDMCERAQWLHIRFMSDTNNAILNSTVQVNEEGITATTKEGDTITVKYSETNDKLVQFIKLLHQHGHAQGDLEACKPLLMNILNNPHIDCLTELYEFCKAGDFKITEDGCILAYKKVRSDFSSEYDKGATKHAIGQITYVDKYDSDRNEVCSHGLHFCSHSYLHTYTAGNNAKVIIVKVNPIHICAIPNDYRHTKGRCTQYMMVGIMDEPDKRFDEVKVEEKIQEKSTKVLTDRIKQTSDLMKEHNGDVSLVAKEMNISESTVKRNMLKYKERQRNVCRTNTE